jgi:hypothetical protein
VAHYTFSILPATKTKTNDAWRHRCA